MNLNLSTKKITKIGMCAALMAIFSQFSIPLPFTTVPITLQIFGLVIISVIVGAQISTISISIFVFLGAIGLPVFSNFTGGFSAIIGPSGGYIIGFIFMAFLVGYASDSKNKILLFITSYIGLGIDYIIGIIQLRFVTGMGIQASLIAGVYPFIFKDLLITAVAILIGLKIKRSLNSIIFENVAA